MPMTTLQWRRLANDTKQDAWRRVLWRSILLSQVRAISLYTGGEGCVVDCTPQSTWQPGYGCCGTSSCWHCACPALAQYPLPTAVVSQQSPRGQTWMNVTTLDWHSTQMLQLVGSGKLPSMPVGQYTELGQPPIANGVVVGNRNCAAASGGRGEKNSAARTTAENYSRPALCETVYQLSVMLSHMPRKAGASRKKTELK